MDILDYCRNSRMVRYAGIYMTGFVRLVLDASGDDFIIVHRLDWTTATHYSIKGQHSDACIHI